MARSFALSGLLRVRQVQQDQAAAQLAVANAQRRAAAQRRSDSEQMLSDASIPDRGDMSAFKVAVANRASAAALLVDSRSLEALAAEHAGAATRVWNQTHRAVKTLENLADRHAQMVRAEDLAAEQVVLDEVASRRKVSL